MPTPIRVTPRQAARLQANVEGTVPRPRRKRDHNADAQRLRGILALVRRLLVLGTPLARVVAVLDAAMQQEKTDDRR